MIKNKELVEASTALVYRDESAICLDGIFNGDMEVHAAIQESEKLSEYAEEIIYSEFEGPSKLSDNSEKALLEFIEKAENVKKKFTNSPVSKMILEELVLRRYGHLELKELRYDVPRLRIVPNSSLLNSGVSYNYRPHRDTWYGAEQGHINHWISVSNVTGASTFYIAPSYFGKVINNNSEIFDLDAWQNDYRAVAVKSVRREERPHPIPLEDIPDNLKCAIVIPRGYEICFAAQHLHGSLPNSTGEVRLSIDYRVCSPDLLSIAPTNIDNRSTGDYLKYMIKHPAFN